MTEEELNTLTSACAIIHGKKYPMPDYLISVGGTPTMPIGDIQLLKAKPKSGKSFVATLLASVVLGARFDCLKPLKDDARVLYIDTEQTVANVAGIDRRIYALNGWDTPSGRFRLLAIATVPMQQRMELIAHNIRCHRPSLTVIDGIADLIPDFNDIAQSRSLMQYLSALAKQYSNAILTVLHENKENSNAKGHLGTEAKQKASDIYSVTKASGIITVSQAETDCRNIPVPPFSLYIDNNGMPRPHRGNEDHIIIATALSQNPTLTKPQLRDIIVKAKNINSNMAYKIIAKAIKDNFITQDENGKITHVMTPPLQTFV